MPDTNHLFHFHLADIDNQPVQLIPALNTTVLMITLLAFMGKTLLNRVV